MRCSQKNRNAIILILVLITCRVSAQDTIQNTKVVLQDSTIEKTKDKAYKLNYKYLIAPTVFIGYGM